MESRNAYGCSIDLPREGKLPTVDQLVGIVEGSGEYAVAWRHERMLALRLVSAGLPVARRAALKPHLTTVVSGGTKVGVSPCKQTLPEQSINCRLSVGKSCVVSS